MDLKQITFQARKVKLSWFGKSSDPNSDSSDIHSVERIVRPHMDLMNAVSELIPHLLVACDLKKGVYDLKSIQVKNNDDGDSFQATLTRMLEDGGIITLKLPYLPCKDRLVAPLDKIASEAEKYVSGEKTQLTMEFTEEEKPQEPKEEKKPTGKGLTEFAEFGSPPDKEEKRGRPGKMNVA